jgi:hypothetical protein
MALVKVVPGLVAAAVGSVQTKLEEEVAANVVEKESNATQRTINVTNNQRRFFFIFSPSTAGYIHISTAKIKKSLMNCERILLDKLEQMYYFQKVSVYSWQNW